MTTEPSKILKANEFLAKRNIDKAFAKVEHSLNTIDYKGIFEAPLWTPDYGRHHSNKYIGFYIAEAAYKYNETRTAPHSLQSDVGVRHPPSAPIVADWH